MADWDAERLRAALRLYLLADAGVVAATKLGVVEAAIAGGVSMVQLRVKGATTLEYLALARGSARSVGHASAVYGQRPGGRSARGGTDGAHVGHSGEEDLGPQ